MSAPPLDVRRLWRLALKFDGSDLSRARKKLLKLFETAQKQFTQLPFQGAALPGHHPQSTSGAWCR
eukprot:4808704-Alexandrium_andersonii.AAC.1